MDVRTPRCGSSLSSPRTVPARLPCLRSPRPGVTASALQVQEAPTKVVSPSFSRVDGRPPQADGDARPLSARASARSMYMSLASGEEVQLASPKHPKLFFFDPEDPERLVEVEARACTVPLRTQGPDQQTQRLRSQVAALEQQLRHQQQEGSRREVQRELERVATQAALRKQVERYAKQVEVATAAVQELKAAVDVHQREKMALQLQLEEQQAQLRQLKQAPPAKKGFGQLAKASARPRKGKAARV